MKRTTIKDIAIALGITPSTVSRALSGSSRVNPVTVERVKMKAAELNYQPNIVASSLRRGRNDTIGMLVPRINRHFFSNVVSAVEEVLNPAGFTLLITQSHERLINEKQAINVLLNNRVAGILMSHSVETLEFDHILRAVKEKVPVVQFDRVSTEVSGARIINDNFTGGYMAAKHLIKSGYKRIAHLTGSLQGNVYSERFKGYVYALEEAGIQLDDSLIVENAITRDTGYSKALELIKNQLIDAFFCAGDFSAVGVFKAAEELKVNIPNEIGLVGFSNEPFAELISPKLSSVEQNAYDMGHLAAKALIRMISGGSLADTSYEEVVPVRLLVRESSMRASVVSDQISIV